MTELDDKLPDFFKSGPIYAAMHEWAIAWYHSRPNEPQLLAKIERLIDDYATERAHEMEEERD